MTLFYSFICSITCANESFVWVSRYSLGLLLLLPQWVIYGKWYILIYSSELQCVRLAAQIDVLLLKLTHFLHKFNAAVRELWEKAGRITWLTVMGFWVLPPRNCCLIRQFSPCYKVVICPPPPICLLMALPKVFFCRKENNQHGNIKITPHIFGWVFV